MGAVFKIVMAVCGVLCALIMAVVAEYGLMAVMLGCVAVVLLDMPERIGRLMNRGDE